MNHFWPLKIRTPHLPLGVAVADSLAILESTGTKPFEEMDGKTKIFRVNLPDCQMAVYDQHGVVSSVWYNDPAGRLTSFGKRRKIQLYLERYTLQGKWDLRMSNG